MIKWNEVVSLLFLFFFDLIVDMSVGSLVGGVEEFILFGEGFDVVRMVVVKIGGVVGMLWFFGDLYICGLMFDF